LAAHAFDPRLLWDNPDNLSTAKQETLA